MRIIIIIIDRGPELRESMLAGIRSFFGSYPQDGRVLMLGSMLELGSESENAHREMGKELASLADRETILLTVGEQAKFIGETAHGQNSLLEWHHFSHVGLAENFLRQNSWDIAYLKGSKAMRLFGLLAES